MIKILFKISIFSIILTFVLLILSDLFVKKNIYHYKQEEYSKEFKGKTDIAFFGSSQPLCTYDPRVFEVELGLNSYNFGTQSQRMVTTKPVIDQIVGENDLKLAVVDLFWNTTIEPPFNEMISTNQLVTLDYLPFSLSKLNAHNKIFGLQNIFDVIPAVKHHYNWKNIANDTIFKLDRRLDFYKGYSTMYSFSNLSWNAAIKNKKVRKTHRINNKIELSNYQKNLINNTATYFKEKNIPVIFVNAPKYKDYITDNQYSQKLLFKQYFKDNNLDFIDYNDHWEDLGLNKYDFRDVEHLNNIGALKVSLHLSNYIKQNYKLNATNLDSNLNRNRYQLIENNFKDIEFNQKLNPEENKRTGVDRIVMYKDFEDRYEILFLGKKDSIKDLKIRIAYFIDESEVEDAPEDLKRRLNKNKFATATVLKRQTNYKDWSFKVFKIDIPFKKVDKFIIINKTNDANTILFNLKDL